MTATTAVLLGTRELQVLVGMSYGKTNRHIGRELGMTEDTVKTHGRRLFRKLGVRDRAHAVRLGFQYGVLRLDHPPPAPTGHPAAVPGHPVPTAWLTPATPRRYSDRHIAACHAAESCPCRTNATWAWPQPNEIKESA